jgi:hypothetical protein
MFDSVTLMTHSTFAATCENISKFEYTFLLYRRFVTVDMGAVYTMLAPINGVVFLDRADQGVRLTVLSWNRTVLQ